MILLMISSSVILLNELRSFQYILYSFFLSFFGRQVAAHESVVVIPGTNITLDMVALHGESTFTLTEAGGDAVFQFNIAAEIVDEAGNTGDLEALFSIVGPKNPRGKLC